jgi:hypothetical protein
MISDIEREMARAKAVVTGTALALALALTNPAPETSRVNCVVASLHDGHVLGVANFFFAL